MMKGVKSNSGTGAAGEHQYAAIFARLQLLVGPEWARRIDHADDALQNVVVTIFRTWWLKDPKLFER